MSNVSFNLDDLTLIGSVAGYELGLADIRLGKLTRGDYEIVNYKSDAEVITARPTDVIQIDFFEASAAPLRKFNSEWTLKNRFADCKKSQYPP